MSPEKLTLFDAEPHGTPCMVCAEVTCTCRAAGTLASGFVAVPGLAPAPVAPMFRRLERSWIRYDSNGDHPTALDDQDMSPCHDIGRGYVAECSSCWLGYQHTDAVHVRNLTR